MMDMEQIAQEIRDLGDHAGRQEVEIDDLQRRHLLIEERLIPAAVADVAHTLAGVQTLLANLAGTVHKLSLEVASQSDRLTLIETVIDHVPAAALTPH